MVIAFVALYMHAVASKLNSNKTHPKSFHFALISSVLSSSTHFMWQNFFSANFIRLNVVVVVVVGVYVLTTNLIRSHCEYVRVFLLPLQLIYTYFLPLAFFLILSVFISCVRTVYIWQYLCACKYVCVQVCVCVCVSCVYFPIKLWSIFSILLWQLLWDHYVWFLKPFYWMCEVC